MPVPFPGNDISLRVVAERSIYSDAPTDNRSIQVDLSRSLGKLGSLSLLGRYGRDQFGKSYSSMMANWVVPLGGRNGISMNLDTSKSEGAARENRYGATFWGSMGGSYGMGGNYQVSIDQDARINADGAYRTRFGNFNASLTREAGSRLFGNMGARGALVMAGGGLIVTRPIADSLLVVRGKELAGSELFVPPDMEGRTRFNGAGYAVVTDLPAYRRINLAFDESGLPWARRFAWNAQRLAAALSCLSGRCPDQAFAAAADLPESAEGRLGSGQRDVGQQLCADRSGRHTLFQCLARRWRSA